MIDDPTVPRNLPPSTPSIVRISHSEPEAGKSTTEWQITVVTLAIGGLLLLAGFACQMLIPERAAVGERAIEAGQWIVSLASTGYAVARGMRKGLHRG